MAVSFMRPYRELDIISLVDIILLLLIFALMVQFGGEHGRTQMQGKGDRETTLRIDIGRGRITDHPELIQIRIVYDTDTSRIDFPPDDRFVGLPHHSFMDMEEVRRTIMLVDKYLSAPMVFPVKGIEVESQASVPFKLVDLFVRQFSTAEQESFSLGYRGGER